MRFVLHGSHRVHAPAGEAHARIEPALVLRQLRDPARRTPKRAARRLLASVGTSSAFAGAIGGRSSPTERSSRPGPAFTAGRASPQPSAVSLCAEGGIHLSQVVRSLRSDWSPPVAAIVGQAASQAVWAARSHVRLESMVPNHPWAVGCA